MASIARTLLGDHERRFGFSAWLHRLVIGALFLGTLSTLYPLLWLVGSAMKSPDDYHGHPLWPTPLNARVVAVPHADNTGPGRIVRVETASPENKTGHIYTLTFVASNEIEVRDATIGAIALAEPHTEDRDLTFDGLTLLLRGRFDTGDTFTIEPRLWQVQNLAEAWAGVNFVRHSMNSFILMAATLVLHLLVNALAAYALSWLRFPGARLVGFAFLMTLMVPWYAIFIPLYLTVTELGLTVPFYGWPAVVLPAAFNAFFLILFKGFFDGLPRDLIDAARIDGAGELQTFWRVAVPLAKPIFGVIVVFSLLATWNDFLWPYLVIGRAEGEPLMVRLYNYELTGTATAESILAALALAMLPPIALFLLFQRQIAAGFTLSGIKG
jgi:multiple sugar transport system permease protein